MKKNLSIQLIVIQIVMSFKGKILKVGTLLFFITILLFSCVTTRLSSNKESISNKKLDIFLCIGQSNMAGRGELVVEDTITLENVFLFNDSLKWEKAKNPLNRYSTIRKDMSIQKLSPAWGFSKALSEKGKKVGLIVNSRGGSSLDEWSKGKPYYLEAIMRVQQAEKTGGVLKGIIWHQGEADRRKYERYTQKFTEMINNMRTDLNSPNLPVIVGQIGNWKGNSDEINKVISELHKHVDKLEYVSSEGLMHKGDSLHFDRKSQIILGERYAQKYLELVKEN